MKLLLDTHAFLWAWMGSPRLSRRARRLLASTENVACLSRASAWEMAVKLSLGKLELAIPLGDLLRDEREKMDIEELPIELAHVLKVATLPFHHRDPFDRLLVAQALEGSFVLLSADPSFDTYGVRRVW